MSDMPELHIKIIATDNPPTGMGEVGIPTVAPADRQRGGATHRQAAPPPADVVRSGEEDARLKASRALPSFPPRPAGDAADFFGHALVLRSQTSKPMPSSWISARRNGVAAAICWKSARE